jgi:hypothetical protein
VAATIRRVYFIPDDSFVVGTLNLVNQETTGTAAGTVARHTAHTTLGAIVIRELTLTTLTSVAEGDVLTFKRNFQPSLTAYFSIYTFNKLSRL